MATVKTIKDVDEDSWLEFKSMAARNKVNMGKLFGDMVEEYKKNTKEFWAYILNHEKILSDEEAADMESIVRRLRKERGFRD